MLDHFSHCTSESFSHKLQFSFFFYKQFQVSFISFYTDTKVETICEEPPLEVAARGKITDVSD